MWIGELEVCTVLAWVWSSLLAGVEASKAKARYL